MNRKPTTLMGMITEGFSLPLVGLVLLVGGLIAVAQHEFDEGGIQAKDPDGFDADPDTDPSPDTDRPPPVKAVSSQEIEANIAAGEFAKAAKQARSAGARKLADRALLFRDLTSAIKPSEMATATLLRLDTGSGTHVGLLRSEAGGELLIELPDGQERKVRANSITSRSELRGDEAKTALRDYLQGQRDAMSSTASGLALHRLSFLAFAADLRPLGTKLLEEALKTPEGPILVDMFGEGDFARLHRARRALAGLPEEDPTQVAMLSGSETREDPIRPASPDDPTPYEPPPVEPDDPEPYEPPPARDPDPDEPKPIRDRATRRSDHRVVKGPDIMDPSKDPAMQDRRWQEAEISYRAGLDLYRGSFGVSPKISNAAIRGALKEFQGAQDSLNQLLNMYPEHPSIERRLQELNKLVIDCMKRQRVG